MWLFSNFGATIRYSFGAMSVVWAIGRPCDKIAANPPSDSDSWREDMGEFCNSTLGEDQACHFSASNCARSVDMVVRWEPPKESQR